MTCGLRMVVVGIKWRYKGCMDAEKLKVEERILMTRQKYFFKGKK